MRRSTRRRASSTLSSRRCGTRRRATRPPSPRAKRRWSPPAATRPRGSGPCPGELGTARAAARDLDEAANAAAAAGKALDDLARTLDEAEEFGRWDLATEDSYAAHARKHERLGEARAAAGYAGQKLQRLRTELADVDVRADALEVQVEGALQQADYFMDGIFVDWIVQRRIQQAQERVGRRRGQVRTLTIELRARATNRQARVAELEQQRRALLESA